MTATPHASAPAITRSVELAPLARPCGLSSGSAGGSLALFGREPALFRTADAPVRVQPFQNELARRRAHLVRLIGCQAQRARLLHQPLDRARAARTISAGIDILAQFQRAADIEPLNHRLHVDAFEVAVEDLAHGDADQFAPHRIAAFEFAFVFQFDLAGDGRQRGVDVQHARHGDRLRCCAGRGARRSRPRSPVTEIGRRCETPERLSTRLSSRAEKASCSTISAM